MSGFEALITGLVVMMTLLLGRMIPEWMKTLGDHTNKGGGPKAA